MIMYRKYMREKEQERLSRLLSEWNSGQEKICYVLKVPNTKKTILF